ncbi:nuclear transport factor 2 family protein [Salegentibacter sp. Hel_I_6]|uniref:nuclear transport factor 2 family protein n=1 Tax=Salegentibacter sp. Hel_I_6 TaxID=1250278 RepID=UPI00056B1D87|nr:nuclear transport factor 2 family protein [Salegentibacter sp. Hel_I_6]
MKKIFQVLIMFLAVNALGQKSGKTDEDQIKDLITNSFQEIFSDLDQKALDVYCTQDFLLLETGEVWNMDKMKGYVKRASEEKTEVKRINSFDFIEIKINGKMAWVAYRNKAEFMLRGEVLREINWLESATAILTEEGWKLQLLHSTLAKD